MENYFNSEGSLDALRITLMIWKHRANPDFVMAFTEALAKFSDEQTVFDEIEFYLPQLAHMIIHLEVDWPIKALERFALVVCQSSLHIALQVSSATSTPIVRRIDLRVAPAVELDPPCCHGGLPTGRCGRKLEPQSKRCVLHPMRANASGNSDC